MPKSSRTQPQTQTRSRGKREQNKNDKRDRLCAAAEKLFTEVGFEATTTAAVAAEAGVATGTLFLYADDKVDLLFLVYHQRAQEAALAATQTLRRHAPLADCIAHLQRGLFELYGECPELGRALIAHLPSARGRNAQATLALEFAMMGQFVALIREGVARGEVDPALDPLVAARNVFNLYYGALMAWSSGALSSSEDAFALFCRALALQVQGFGHGAPTRRGKTGRS